MKWFVDISQRYAKMRAHTATHLLHAAIQEYFPLTKQAWSLVDQDYLRFDYASEELLTHEQLESISIKINQWIYNAYAVETKVSSYQSAIAQWAKAFFEDKYWDEVRVVSIQKDWGEILSIELCGWTHCNNTSQIGAFIIVEHGGVASWVKRLVAYTWPKVSEYAQSTYNSLVHLAHKLKAQPQHLDQKIEKLLKEQKEYTDTIERLEEQQILSILMSISPANESKFDFLIDVDKYDWLKTFSFKAIVDKIKSHFDAEKKVCVFKSDGSFALVWPSSKDFAHENKLKWGGSDSFYQWKDQEIIHKV